MTPSHGPGEAPATDRPRLWLLGAITFVVVGWALHATAVVMVPVAFALFLALMLAPMVAWVKARVPERLGWLGHVAASGVLLVVAVVFVGGLWLSAQRVLAAFPGVSRSLGEVVPGFGAERGEGSAAPAAGAPGPAGAAQEPGAGPDGGGTAEGDGAPSTIAGALSQIEGVGENLAGRVSEFVAGSATSVLNAATATLSGAILVFFLTLLMLIDAPGWRRRLSRILGPGGRHDLFETAEVVGRQVRRYLVIRAAMGALTAVLYVAWLWITGVDLLLVWALLTFLLSFVPTLGSVASGVLPAVYAVFTKDFGTAVLVGLGLLAIEQVIGNFIDPRVSGRLISVSPLVILVSLLLWGWVWGAPGLLLAVPMTIAALVICAHVDALRPVALLLSDRRSMDEVDELATR